jgi:hypothetical protein
MAHVWESKNFVNTTFKHSVINVITFPNLCSLVYLSFVTRGHVNEAHLVLKVQRLLYSSCNGYWKINSVKRTRYSLGLLFAVYVEALDMSSIVGYYLSSVF